MVYVPCQDRPARLSRAQDSRDCIQWGEVLPAVLTAGIQTGTQQNSEGGAGVQTCLPSGQESAIGTGLIFCNDFISSYIMPYLQTSPYANFQEAIVRRTIMSGNGRFQLMGMLVAMLFGIIIAACAGVAPAPVVSEPVAEEMMQDMTSTLQTVMDRGHVICVGNAAAPGFGYLAEDGSFSGFDTDFCRALAAAIFGDSEAYEIRPATAAERFTVLAAGEGDVLVRNTTHTMSRDTDLAGNFAPTTFYDGQGLMVRAADGINSLEDLAGGAICVATGTTTELNLADQMAARGIEYEPVVFESTDETVTAYEEGRCDAYTTDKSGLVGRRAVFADPSAHIILDATLSKEPLAPMVRHGDDQWLDIVTWVVNATFLAEEMGITSGNVDSMMDSSDPNVRRLLGMEGEFGAKIGLDNNWSYNVLKQVGNYGEIYNRNLGPDTAYSIPRGLNRSWVDGGLLYAPPIR